MGTIEAFETNLKEALTHLYDPAYQPPDLMWQVTGCSPKHGVTAIQSVLIQAIEALKPSADIPPNARVRRFYDLLTLRYVQESTQVNVAQQLNISLRHLRREQQQAIRVLAQRLWDQQGVSEAPAGSGPLSAASRPSPETIPADGDLASWRSQVRQELVSLEQQAPGAVADVEATIQSALKVGQALTSPRNISLQATVPDEAGVMAALHPSLLSQILVTAIEKLVQVMSSGEIVLSAATEGEQLAITIAGSPVISETLPESDLIQEILSTQNGSVEVRQGEGQAIFQIGLPLAHSVKVLVIDDNEDLVHWYRRYTAQTKYQITHLAEAQQVFDVVMWSRPDIIVLDIMLPDIDGWELLTHLHEHPETRTTPVVICSVVKREALALALGAAVYLPKPVRRQQFIQALDQALEWGVTRASRTEANIAATG